MVNETDSEAINKTSKVNRIVHCHQVLLLKERINSRMS